MEKLTLRVGRVPFRFGPKCVGHSRFEASFAEAGLGGWRAVSDAAAMAGLRRHRNTAPLATACPADHADFCCFQMIDADRFLTDGTLCGSDGPFGVRFMRC